jgi:hypothetical protein
LLRVLRGFLRGGPAILTDQIDWIPEPGTAPLTIDLQGFFGQVFDERRLNPP